MNPWENRSALGTLPALRETSKHSKTNPMGLFAATPRGPRVPDRRGMLNAAVPLNCGWVMLAGA